MKENQRDAFFQSQDLNCQDSGKLFQLIRKHNGTLTEPTSTVSYCGHAYSKGELLNACFANLATPTSQEAESSNQQSIKAQYCSLLGDSSAKSVIFTLEEVSEAIKNTEVQQGGWFR